MTRYIAADDFLDLFYVASAGQDKAFIETVEMVVADTPTADVAPVVHGKWKETEPLMCGTYGNAWWLFECSNCGRTYFTTHKYCPNCGAKMDLED